ncbi:MAG: tetratricopeptide repeat protein, partial [Candidatus Mariimomonas ferrooxydans]
STIYYNRGLTYLMMGNHRQAIPDFNKSISLKPGDNPAYIERVFAYKLAVKDYSRGIRSNPRNIEYYINRGVILARLGQFKQALEDFNKAISLKPGLAFTYYNRGLVYMDSGDYQKAVRDFRIAAGMGDKKAQNYLKSKGMGW